MPVILSAIGCSVVMILLILRLSTFFPVKLLGTTILVAIAFIYVGFSLKENSTNNIIVEGVVAVVFYFIAIVGYSTHPKLIAYGIMSHGIWDVLHHHSLFVSTMTPSYWPTFCITVDVIAGIFLWMRFRKDRIKSQRVSS